MRITRTLFPRAAAIASAALLALPLAAAANPGTGPQLVQRSGRMVILHADMRDGTSTRQWTLVNGMSHLPVRAPDDVWIDPGTPVRLQGSMRNGTLVLANSVTAVKRTGRSPLEADAATRAATPSVENTVVLQVSFNSGGPAYTTPTQPQATSLMFDAPGGGLPHSADSLNAYYQEQTYGQISFSGSVIPVSIPGPASACGASSPNFDGDALSTWLDDAELAAGIDPNNDKAYQHVVLAFASVSQCGLSGAAGLAEVGGNHVWINGYFVVPVLSHELGHNLGLYHAGGLQCMNAGIASPMGNSCTGDGLEYKDPYDAMGQSDPGDGSMVVRQMNMEHKLTLGVVPDSAKQVVGVTGTYQLAPMETLTGTVQLLRLPKPGGGSYYVEYRRPLGFFDSQAPQAHFPGVYIHTESPQPLGTPNGSDTALIDMHPTTTVGSAGWADAAMDVGQVFNDPLRGITIQNLAQDANGATLAITMPVDTTPPSRPGRLSAIVSGTSVSLQWIAASDDFAVDSYRVARDGAQIASLAATTFVDTGLAPGATVTYAVTAVDATGNVGEPATVSVTLPDTIAPSAPVNVTATVSRDGQVHIAWGASTDNVGVTSYRILRAGTGIAQANVTSFVDRTPRSGTGATVTYSVVAFDLVGNASAPGVAKPLRAALLRTLGAAHLKARRAKGSALVRVTGSVSDVKAVCRVRLGHAKWRRCAVKASGAFSAKLRGTGASQVTLALRDELGRKRVLTLRVRS